MAQDRRTTTSQFNPSDAAGTSQTTEAGSAALPDTASAAPPYPNQRVSDAPGGATGGQGTQAASGVVDQAKQTLSDVAGRAGEEVTTRLESGKGRAAEGIGSLAQALRQTSQQLRDQNQTGVTQYLDMAADQVEQFSGYLQTRDVHQIVDQVENIARRQPALFLGAAFALGVLGARFLKSSSPHGAGSSDYSTGRSADYGRRTGYRQRYQASSGSAGAGLGSMADLGTAGGENGI